MAEIPHVQDPVMKYARSLGWKTRRMQYIMRNGCPDSWFFKDGNVIIIEFKNLGDSPNEVQKREHARLRSVGMKVYVIDNEEDGCAIFDRYAFRKIHPGSTDDDI